MRIVDLKPESDWILTITDAEGRRGRFDVSPYLQFEAFQPLRDPAEFNKVTHGGYFVEWDCGADLSVDTLEAHWQVLDEAHAA